MAPFRWGSKTKKWQIKAKTYAPPFRLGSKTKKWQIEAKSTWHHFGEKTNWCRPPKKELKRKAHELENPDASYGPPTQGFKICFNWVQIGSQEFGSRTPSKEGLSLPISVLVTGLPSMSLFRYSLRVCQAQTKLIRGVQHLA